MLAKYIETWLFNYLSDWVADHESLNAQTGIFKGSLRLSNVSLKPRRWKLSMGYILEMESARIGSLSVAADWYRLRDGGLFCEISNVDLAFRLLPTNEDEWGSLMRYEGEVNIEAEVLKVLDQSDVTKIGSRGSWHQRVLVPYLRDVLKSARISLNRVKITLLIPLNSRNSVFSLTVFAESIDLQGGSEGEVTDVSGATFSGELSVRGLSLSIGCLLVDREDVEDDGGLGLDVSWVSSQLNETAVLNPVYGSVNFTYRHTGLLPNINLNSADEIDSNIIRPSLDLSCKLDNIEVSPTVDQLRAIMAALSVVARQNAHTIRAARVQPEFSPWAWWLAAERADASTVIASVGVKGTSTFSSSSGSLPENFFVTPGLRPATADIPDIERSLTASDFDDIEREGESSAKARWRWAYVAVLWLVRDRRQARCSSVFSPEVVERAAKYLCILDKLLVLRFTAALDSKEAAGRLDKDTVAVAMEFTYMTERFTERDAKYLRDIGYKNFVKRCRNRWSAEKMRAALKAMRIVETELGEGQRVGMNVDASFRKDLLGRRSWVNKSFKRYHDGQSGRAPRAESVLEYVSYLLVGDDESLLGFSDQEVLGIISDLRRQRAFEIESESSDDAAIRDNAIRHVAGMSVDARVAINRVCLSVLKTMSRTNQSHSHIQVLMFVVYDVSSTIGVWTHGQVLKYSIVTSVRSIQLFDSDGDAVLSCCPAEGTAVEVSMSPSSNSVVGLRSETASSADGKEGEENYYASLIHKKERRVNLSVTISHMDIFIKKTLFSAVGEMILHIKGLSSAIRPSNFSATCDKARVFSTMSSFKAAQLSVYQGVADVMRQLAVNTTNVVRLQSLLSSFPSPPTIDAVAVSKGICVNVMDDESTGGLEVAVGGVVVRTGDASSFPSVSAAAAADAEEEANDQSRDRDTESAKLFERCVTAASTASSLSVLPISVVASGLRVSLVKDDGRRTDDVLTNFTVFGHIKLQRYNVFTLLDWPLALRNPATYIDLFCSPFVLALSAKDVISAVSIVAPIVSALRTLLDSLAPSRTSSVDTIPVSTSTRLDSSHTTDQPRAGSHLSALVGMSLQVFADSVQCSILSGDTNNAVECIVAVLTDLASRCEPRLEGGRAYRLFRKTALQRLVSLGVSADAAESLLSAFCADSSYHEHKSLGRVHHAAEVHALGLLGDERWDSCLFRSRASVVTLSATSLHCSVVLSPSVSKANMGLDSFSVSDKEGYVLLELSRVVGSRERDNGVGVDLKTKSGQPRMSVSDPQQTHDEASKHSVLASINARIIAGSAPDVSPSSASALNVTFCRSFDAAAAVSSSISSASDVIVVHAGAVSVLLCTGVIFSLVSHVAESVAEVLQHTRRQRNPTAPNRFDSAVTTSSIRTSISCTVRAGSVVLADEKCLLSQLRFKELQVAMPSSVDVEGIDKDLFLVASMHQLNVYDLTAHGFMHQNIIWGLVRPLTDTPLIFLELHTRRQIDRPGEITRDLTISLQGLRVCLIYRFIDELILFIKERLMNRMDSVWRSDVLAVLAEKDNNSGKGGGIPRQASSITSTPMSQAQDPHHFSDGLTSGHMKIFDDACSVYNDDDRDNLIMSFLPPQKEDESARDSTDYEINHVRERAPTADSSLTGQSEDKPVPRVVVNLIASDFVALAPRNASSADIVSLVVSKVSLSAKTVSDTWPMPDSQSNILNSEHLYFDVDTNKWSVSHRDRGPTFRSKTTTAAVTAGTSAFLRLTIELSEIEVFASLSGPLSKAGSTNHGLELLPLEVCEGAEVFASGRHVQRNSSGPTTARSSAATAAASPGSFLPHSLTTAAAARMYSVLGQQWRKLTQEKFNLFYLQDFPSSSPENRGRLASGNRIILSDTSEFSRLNLSISMAELCLLESIWFDNIFEESPLFPRTDAIDSAFEAAQLDPFPAYGTKEYIQLLRNRQWRNDIIVLLADVKLTCFMDIDYFAVAPASMTPLLLSLCGRRNGLPPEVQAIYQASNSYGTKPHGSDANRGSWQNVAIPVADVSVSNLVLSVSSDNGITSLGLSAGFVDITDSRMQQDVTPKPPFKPFIRLGRSGVGVYRKYGRVNPDFGFDLDESEYSILAPQDAPLRVSMLSYVGTRWTMCNVGLDSPDVSLMDLGIFIAVSDIFAGYFVIPECGHPGVVESYRQRVAAGADSSDQPYGGTDTRVFIRRPHVSIIASTEDSQSMFLETDKGVYYRHIVDSAGAKRMELYLYDAALVMLKVYRRASEERGLRGCAGSGRGIRTLVEFFSGAFFYDFFKEGGRPHIDITFHTIRSVSLDSPTSEEAHLVDSKDPQSAAKYVDLSPRRSELKPVSIPRPQCIVPVLSHNATFTDDSCDLVFSYEDILFCLGVLSRMTSVGGAPAGEESEDDDGFNTKRGEVAGVVASFREDSRETDIPHSPRVTLPPLAARTGSNGPAIRLYRAMSQSFKILSPIPDNDGEDRDSDEDEEDVAVAATSSPRRPSDGGVKYGEQQQQQSDGRAPRPPLSPSIFAVIAVSGVKFILVDNLLGLHRPLLQVFLNSTDVAFDVAQTESFLADTNGREHTSYQTTALPTLKCHVRSEFWIDYFNNMKKCWEPLLDRFIFNALYERSTSRGVGIVIRTPTALHVNVSGACLKCVDDLLHMLKEQALKSSDGDHMHSMHSCDKELEEPSASPALPDADAVLDEMRITSQSIYKVKKDYRIEPSSRRRMRQKPYTKRRHSSLGNSIAGDVLPHSDQGTARRPIPPDVEHVRYRALELQTRVGFSLLNLTGQPIRYLQSWDGGRRTVQYLNDKERGMLNFIPTLTTIRNNQIIEKGFNVQESRGDEDVFDNRPMLRGRGGKTTAEVVGHRHIAVQVSGYCWLPRVQVDEFEVKYTDLHAVTGRHNIQNIMKGFVPTPGTIMTINALKMVAEVTPNLGGRLLSLRSVFAIVNNTTHDIELLATVSEPNDLSQRNLTEKSAHSAIASDIENRASNDAFLLKSKETWHTPLALLHRSAIGCDGKALGSLYLRPMGLTPILQSSSLSNAVPDRVDYSTDPIWLSDIVQKSAEIFSHSAFEFGADGLITETNEKEKGFQLHCNIHTKLRLDSASNPRYRHDIENLSGPFSPSAFRLPPFWYNVEVLRYGSLAFFPSDLDLVTDNLVTFGKSKPDGAPRSIFMKGLDNIMFHKHGSREVQYSPLHYRIVIHPPISLENLLSSEAYFEIVHAVSKRPLWASYLQPGNTVNIHAVSLTEPLVLRITLRYCRTVDGILIHKGAVQSADGENIANRVQKAFGGSEGANTTGDGAAFVFLFDSAGQRLRLSIENLLGRGGQRRICVYCPYWIVNTCQYSVRVREDGRLSGLPAGSVSHQKDGSKALVYGLSNHRTGEEKEADGPGFPSPNGQSPLASLSGVGQGVFPGLPGPLHSSRAREIDEDSHLEELLGDMKLDALQAHAFMFNYNEELTLLGAKRVCIQLDDSEWSSPIGLENVEINQTLTVVDAIRGELEIGFKISALPSRRTKVVRLLPRFSIVNKVEDHNLKLVQKSASFLADGKEVSVSTKSTRLFHFPNARSERKVSVQLDGSFEPSVPFSIDGLGAYTLHIKRRLDLASIPHINSHGAPEYAVHLPGSEIGIYFETDWKEQNIVVKGLKSDGFAATCTDVQIEVGDALVAIDDIPVNGAQFEFAMALLKEKVHVRGGCTVVFRTVEEKMRLVRNALKASKGSSVPPPQSTGGKITLTSPLTNSPRDDRGTGGTRENLSSSTSPRVPIVSDLESLETEVTDNSLLLRVELRNFESMTAVLIEKADQKAMSEYRLNNFSLSCCIYYRQKGVAGNRWAMLSPGQSTFYVFEDPFKAHKLLIRAGPNLLCPKRPQEQLEGAGESSSVPSVLKILRDSVQLSSWGSSSNPDNNAVVVSFDEIGFKGKLPVGAVSAKANLRIEVISEGPAKIMNIISDRSVLPRELHYCDNFARDQRRVLKQKMLLLEKSLRVRDESNGSVASEEQGYVHTLKSDIVKTVSLSQKLLTQRGILPRDPRSSSSLSLSHNIQQSQSPGSNHLTEDIPSYCPFESVLGDYDINSCDMLFVQVLEARELLPFVTGQPEDVFCSIYLKSNILADIKLGKLTEGANLFLKRWYTYACDQTLDPAWIGQRFILPVPKRAVDTPRGLSVRVAIHATTSVGVSRFMGKVDVPLASLKSEDSLCGWYPLRPNQGTPSLYSMEITGSLKLRLQWIHTCQGLVKYTVQGLRSRLYELRCVNKAVERIASLEFLATAANNDRRGTDQHLNTKRAFLSSAGKTGQLISSATGLLNSTVHSASGVISSTVISASDVLQSTVTSASGVLHSTVGTFRGPRHAVKMEKLDFSRLGDLGDLKSPLSSDSAGVSSATILGGFRSKRGLRSLDNLNKVANESLPLSLTNRNFDDTAIPQSASHGEQEHKIDRLSARVTDLRSVYMSRHATLVRTSSRMAKDFQNKHWWPNLRKNSLPVAPPLAPPPAVVGKWIEWMGRTEAADAAHEEFMRRFNFEARRAHMHVHTSKGRLEVTPLQVMNLPSTISSIAPLTVRLTYGTEKYSTHPVAYSPNASWYQDTTLLGGDTSGDLAHRDGNARYVRLVRRQNEALKKSYQVDTLNIRGHLVVRLVAATLPQKIEVARLEIPVFNLLECTCALTSEQSVGGRGEGREEEEGEYTRWFPLRLRSEAIPGEGEMDTFEMSIMSEQPTPEAFGYLPCIRLRVKWVPDLNVAVDTTTVNTIALTRPPPPASRAKISGHPKDRGDVGVYSSTPPDTYFRLQLPSLSISTIDSERARDVLQIFISGIETRHFKTQSVSEFLVNVNTLQVDNQLPDAVAPVTVFPTFTKFPQPVVRMYLRRNETLSAQSASLQCFDDFELVAQELDIELEQATVVAWWALARDYINSFPLYLSDRAAAVGLAKAESTKSKAAALSSKSSDSSRLYIDRFNLHPIKINVSFVMSPSLSSESTEKASHGIRRDFYYVESFFLLRHVGEIILDLTSSISNAPLYIAGMQKDHLFISSNDLLQTLQSIYYYSVVSQLYKIVGSLELVGNPVALVSSLGIGVRSFFYEPASALIKDPTNLEQIGRAAVKGTVHLLTNTADGLIGSSTTFTRSIGRSFAKLSMDDGFIHRREALQRKSNTRADAMLKPLYDIGNGILSGLSGLVMVPYRDVHQYGAKGFISGVAKGFVGLPVKAGVGVLDAVTHTGDAAREIVNAGAGTSLAPPARRRRFSALFGPDGRLLPYSFTNALGTHVLQSLQRSNELSPWQKYRLLDRQHLARLIAGRRESLQREAREAALAVLHARGRSLSVASTAGERPLSSKSTSLGRDNFARNPAEELFDTGEFVLHTAVIKRGLDLEDIVILTTLRLAVIRCHKKGLGSALEKRWEAPTAYLLEPSLQHFGGGMVLTLSAESPAATATAALVRTDGPGVRVGYERVNSRKVSANQFAISGDYGTEDTLATLYNCVNAVINNPLKLIDFPSSHFWEDDEGIVHVGPWEFKLWHAESADSEELEFETRRRQRERLIDTLQTERWVFSDESEAGKSQLLDRSGRPEASTLAPPSLPMPRSPKWLRDERRRSISAQTDIADVLQKLEAMEKALGGDMESGDGDDFTPRAAADRGPGPQSDTNSVSMPMQPLHVAARRLKEGIISFDEFCELERRDREFSLYSRNSEPIKWDDIYHLRHDDFNSGVVNDSVGSAVPAPKDVGAGGGIDMFVSGGGGEDAESGGLGKRGVDESGRQRRSLSAAAYAVGSDDVTRPPSRARAASLRGQRDEEKFSVSSESADRHDGYGQEPSISSPDRKKSRLQSENAVSPALLAPWQLAAIQHAKYSANR